MEECKSVWCVFSWCYVVLFTDLPNICWSMRSLSEPTQIEIVISKRIFGEKERWQLSIISKSTLILFIKLAYLIVLIKISSCKETSCISSVYVTKPGRPRQVPPSHMYQYDQIFSWMHLETDISALTTLARDSLTLVSVQEDIANWDKPEQYFMWTAYCITNTLQ